MSLLKEPIMPEQKALEEQGRILDAEKLPINWLPLEVLADIFWTAVQLEDTDFAMNQPFHATPVIISHVCRKWRDVALATPPLWSYLGFSTSRFYATPLLTFLERAGSSPLTLFYRGGPQVASEEEHAALNLFFALFADHLTRIRSMSLHFRNADALRALLDAFPPGPTTKLISLRNLDLAITGERITRFSGYLASTLSPALNATWRSAFAPLTELRLSQVPPSVIHPDLLVRLTILELRYAYPALRLSKLCSNFLSNTPNLQELILPHIIPHIDVNADATSIVALPNLKRFEWSYPSPKLLHRVLASIEMPAVESFEIWFEPSATKSSEQSYHHDTLSVLHYPKLRDLTLITSAKDESGLDLRLFSFPAIEKIELINVPVRSKSKPSSRSKSKARTSTPKKTLPTIPRLESIFRDPRLQQLTDLTLSRFQFPTDYARMEALLGYMPRVTSLSLESCHGVGILLKALQAVSATGTLLSSASTSPKKVITSPSTNGTSNINPLTTFALRSPNQSRITRHGGVKLCPQLDALSFWDCHDLEINSLRAVVRTRNGSFYTDEWDQVGMSGGGGDGSGLGTTSQPNGTHAQGIQGLQGAQTAPAVHNSNMNDTQLGPLPPVSSSDSQISLNLIPAPVPAVLNPTPTTPAPSLGSAQPPLSSSSSSSSAIQGKRNSDVFDLDDPRTCSTRWNHHKEQVNRAVMVANAEVLELASKTAPIPDSIAVPVTERVIRPLRRSRRQGPALQSDDPSHSGLPASSGISSLNASIHPEEPTTTNVISSFITSQETNSSANIVFIRLSRCKRILSEHAESLKEDGVLDVTWSPYKGDPKAAKVSLELDQPHPTETAASIPKVSLNPDVNHANAHVDTTNLPPPDPSTSLTLAPSSS